MLDAIQRKLGIAEDEASDLADLERETEPEDVLAEIERLRAVGVDQDPLGRRSATDYGVGVRPTVAGPMAERLSADD